METLFLVGRLMAALMYLLLGISYFVYLSSFVDYARSRRVPFPFLSVPLAGLTQILGGLSIGLVFYPLVGITAIVAYHCIVAFIVHRPKAQDSAKEWFSESSQFMRNLAIAGINIMLLAGPIWTSSPTP